MRITRITKKQNKEKDKKEIEILNKSRRNQI